MKRVKSACLLQTLHFQLKEDLPHDQAVIAVQDEVKHYKARMNMRRVAYKIDEETTQPDGSIIIRIRKQYNTSPVGEYLN